MTPEVREAEILATPPFARPTASGVVAVALSDRNSYFTRKNIAAGLQFILATLSDGWTIRPFVPQGPTVWTYLALGYSQGEAVRSAKRQSTNLRRLSRNGAGGDARYRDCQWDDLTGGDNSPLFRAAVERLDKAYETNAAFRKDVQELTRTALQGRGAESSEAVAVGYRYVIEEFACMTILQEVLGVEEMAWVYHKPVGLVDRLFEGTPYGLPKVQGASLVVVNAENDEFIAALGGQT
ncbi:hypothetical protein BSKO_10830 [Bryopsis sp. KO-2023]|nr:hypothetical protein BSKO_10830 [Bryopsis sp. KO-2023]